MDFIKAFIKQMPWKLVGIFLGGLVLGLIWAYVISPTEFVNATPAYLRSDLQDDYLRMAINTYAVNGDQNQAIEHWRNLGPNAQIILDGVRGNPGDLNSTTVQSYTELINGFVSSGGTPISAGGNSNALARTIVFGVGGVLLLGVLVAGGLYAYRLLGKRSSGEVTAVMQSAEISRNAEKTNFEDLGLAPPITQTMTTYVLGDDLYDESFSIDSQAGEFMGEYGVGVSESIGVGDPKKVTALEIWLFDKNDIKTATKVLMSNHAFADQTIRARLEPKGELVMVEPQAQILMETATLQLLATVVDLEYGKGPLPDDSYFERITLELAIWPRQG